MLKEIEFRFATKTYEYVSAIFDEIPTDEEYDKARRCAELHKNYNEAAKQQTCPHKNVKTYALGNKITKACLDCPTVWEGIADKKIGELLWQEKRKIQEEVK